MSHRPNRSLIFKRFTLAFCLISFPQLVSADSTFDHTMFDKILQAFVNNKGFVDYDTLLKTADGSLNDYLQSLEKANVKHFSPPEQTAFWINAYNANALRLLMDHPVHRVDENFAIFDIPLKVAGQKLSLNDIEHRVLRGQLNPKNQKGPVRGLAPEKFDPRIHFALVFGAMSCPKLQATAYTGENLEKVLTMAATRFANTAKHLRIENGRLHVSALMHWYADDFKPLGGSAAYLSTLVDPKKRADGTKIKLLLATAYDQTIFEFDWLLNDQYNASQDR